MQFEIYILAVREFLRGDFRALFLVVGYRNEQAHKYDGRLE